LLRKHPGHIAVSIVGVLVVIVVGCLVAVPHSPLPRGGIQIHFAERSVGADPLEKIVGVCCLFGFLFTLGSWRER
jgi:hypothetical protein